MKSFSSLSLLRFEGRELLPLGHDLTGKLLWTHCIDYFLHRCLPDWLRFRKMPTAPTALVSELQLVWVSLVSHGFFLPRNPVIL